jgi:ribosomal-protein-alanine N-acetyltransferase
MPKTTSQVIRLARYADSSVIGAMSRDLIENGLGWRWKPNRIRQLIAHNDASVLVAEQDHCIAGFAAVSFSETSAHINLFAVDPEYRRLGLASSLIDWIVRSCRTAGIANVNLEVRSGNPAAISCYQNNGFVSVGVKRGYYNGIEDATLMTLTLISSEIEANRPR